MKLSSRVASNPLTAALATGAMSLADPALAIQSKYNLPPAVTDIAREIHWLHWFMLIICGVIFVAVFGVMFYSIWAHRKSRGHKPADFHESTAVEIAWTIVPFLIVIGMAIAGHQDRGRDERHVQRRPDDQGHRLPVEVGLRLPQGRRRGHQLPVATCPRRVRRSTAMPARPTEANTNYLIEVDNELVVPVNKKVRIIMTANDVIHAWTIPAFGVKQDAIPGFVRDTWFRAEKIGTYRGQCAELCGKDHAFMPIVVDVVSEADYTAWVDEKRRRCAAKADDPNKVWTAAELRTRGEKVYAANCVACHQANGQGVPGAFPALDNCPVRGTTRRSRSHIMLNGGKNGRWRWPRSSSCPTPSLPPSSPTPATTGATRTNRSAEGVQRGAQVARRIDRRQRTAYARQQDSNERSRSTITPTATSHGHDHEHGHPHGWRRWLYATNHKDIGTMYLWFSLHHVHARRRSTRCCIRTELFQPGLQFFEPEFFNQLTTMHGLIMVFGAIMPAFVGFANWMIPLHDRRRRTWRSRA